MTEKIIKDFLEARKQVSQAENILRQNFADLVVEYIESKK